LREVENEINALGLRILVVTFENNSVTQAYVRDTNLQWPIMVDESRELYKAYHMLRGRWWDIYGPASWWIYAKLLFKGRRMAASSSDFNQLGGDVLIDPDGVVRIHHVGNGPADRPTVASIIERVKLAKDF
jgi:hypothetical protein